MGFKKTVLAVTLGGLFISTGVLAGSNSQGASNGQPFQELYQQIEENRALIASNQSSISALNMEMDNLTGRVDGIDTHLATVASQVDTNTSLIADAMQRIDMAEGNIAALQGDLNTLASQLTSEVTRLDGELATVQNQINDLVSDNAALAAQLSEYITELRTLIDSNSLAIDGLLVDIALLNGQVSTNNSRLISLENWRAMVDSKLGTHTSQIADLYSRITNIEIRVGALESALSPIPTFIGYATWTQDAYRQSDAEQDALMDTACAASYPGTSAATIDEIVSGITDMPISNDSGRWLLGKCPNCEGLTNTGLVSGHGRNCVTPGNAFPTSLPWTDTNYCWTSTRSAACVQ